MRDSKELTCILSKYLCLDKRRVVFLSGMIQSILVVRSISLPRIVTSIVGGGKASSWYRRAQRFFANARLDMDDVARILYAFFFYRSESDFSDVRSN